MLEDLLNLADASNGLNIVDNIVVGVNFPIAGDLVIPEGVVDISSKVFMSNSAITSVTFPASLRSIGEYAFSKCVNLQSIKFHSDSHLLDIGNHCFDHCVSLTDIDLPGSLEYIGEYAFAYCACFTAEMKKKSVVAYSNVFSNKDLAEMHSLYTIKSLTVPMNAQIGPHCFEGTEIHTLYVNAAIVSPYAFSGAYVHRVVWNSSDQCISDYCFELCRDLKEFIISERAAKTLREIGVRSFRGCKSLCRFIIPDGVTTIRNEAFLSSGLRYFKASEALELIGDGAFSSTPCTSVDLSQAKQLKKIGSQAFSFTQITQLYVVSSQSILLDNIVGGCVMLEMISIGDQINNVICVSKDAYASGVVDSTMIITGKNTKVAGGWQTSVLLLPTEAPEPDAGSISSNKYCSLNPDLIGSYGRCPDMKHTIIKY